MRALQCDASKGELSLEEVAVPEILNTDDVIIRVAYAGLCGTDLHIMSVGRTRGPGHVTRDTWRCRESSRCAAARR